MLTFLPQRADGLTIARGLMPIAAQLALRAEVGDDRRERGVDVGHDDRRLATS